MFTNVTTASLMTADELLKLSLPDKCAELVRGQLVVREPPGTWHGAVAGNLAYFMTDFVRRGDFGVVLPQDTGFKIATDPDTVRAPDVAFVSSERAEQIPVRGYAQLAPDIVAEIVSSTDRPGEVLAKVGEWLDAGAALVWIIYAARSEALVYRADGSLTVLGLEDALDGENVLPGFSCPLRSIVTPLR